MFQIWGGGNAMQIGKEGKALKKKKKKSPIWPEVTTGRRMLMSLL